MSPAYPRLKPKALAGIAPYLCRCSTFQMKAPVFPDSRPTRSQEPKKRTIPLLAWSSAPSGLSLAPSQAME